MLSPKDCRKKQKDDDARDFQPERDGHSDNPPDNQAAERALFKVKQKLQGYGAACHDVLSVEGQVKHLIADARDPENLCVLFPGWAPWL